jgi:succinate dehydrogenase/fumarate reductase flavoprotein subunit
MVSGYQRQAKYLCRGSQEAVRWVLVWEWQFLRHNDYFVRQRRFPQVHRGSCDPISHIVLKVYSTLGVEQKRLPCAHRG